jgi:hypothetical protein
MNLSPLGGLVAVPVCLCGFPTFPSGAGRRVVNKVNGIQEKKESLPYNMTGTCHKIHKGHKSKLTELNQCLYPQSL